MTKQFLAPILSDAINYEFKIIHDRLYIYIFYIPFLPASQSDYLFVLLSICLLSVSPPACLSNVCLPVCLPPVG